MENEINNNSRLSKTQKVFQLYVKNSTKENYKVSKSHQFIPLFHRTSNQLYNRRARALLINPKNYPIKIKHANSVNYKGLQVADLISWSSFQAVEACL